MILILIGSSGSGKTVTQKELVQSFGFKRIVSYTTRPMREEETDGVDYHFISDDEFSTMLRNEAFAEWSAYSQNRKYATAKLDYLSDDNQVVVLTPDGFRQVQKVFSNQNIRTVLIRSSLGSRIKRYIDRIGEDKFTFDDKNEIAARVERDYGMFLNMERDVDLVVDNDGDKTVYDIATEIVQYFHIDNR